MSEVLCSGLPVLDGPVLMGHGFHAGEPGVRQLYDDLQRTSSAELEHAILSRPEWETETRLVDGENLSTVIPDPNGSRAQRIAAQYRERARSYSLAIHPHGNDMPGSESAIYGAAASPLVRGAVSYLGISRAIIRTQGVEATSAAMMSIELGDSRSFLSPAAVHEKLVALKSGMVLEEAAIEEYAYIADISTATARQLGLQSRYEAFEPLTRRDTEVLNEVLGQGALELFAVAWDANLFDDVTGFRGELLGRFPLPQDVVFRDRI